MESITIAPTERKDLIVGMKREIRPSRRLRMHIVLLASEGNSPTEIARVLYCSRTTVYEIVGRVVREGQKAFDDRRRRGPAPLVEGSAWKLLEDLTEGVLPTDRGWLRSRWSCKLLVVELFKERALVVSRETVRRVLHRLKKLTYMYVQGLYRQMQDRGLSARTVQYTHAVLHRALKQAVRWSLIPRNVCEGVDVPQVRREEMRPLNAEQARRLLRSASGERLEAFYVLAVHTGMRPGELLGLRWEDVTLSDEGGTLQLNGVLSDGELATPKTKGSRRRIRLSTGSARALKAHRKRQLAEIIQRPGLWQDCGLVFPSSVGTPLFHRNVVRSFKALLKRADLPPSVRLYDLRHTCATLLLSRNVHPKYVQELLGHASISQTLDTYSHVIEGMDGGLTDAIDEALG